MRNKRRRSQELRNNAHHLDPFLDEFLADNEDEFSDSYAGHTGVELPIPEVPAGSVLAHALASVYRGSPVTAVDSPPGAGKSTMVSQLVSYLFRASDLSITVAVPTNNQGSDLSARIAEELADVEEILGYVPLVVASKSMITPEGALSVAPADEETRVIYVRTLSSCRQSPPECDLLIVEEAYQTTFADFAEGADGAQQVLVVGDPGQIGPVVAFDADAWSRMRAAPHMRTPEVLRMRDDATKLHLRNTYRLGPQTTSVIAPLYQFEFSSMRPDRWLEGCQGQELAAIEVDARTTPYDLETMQTVADAATAYIGRRLHETIDGKDVVSLIEPQDIAIVVSRNAQVSALEALLSQAGYELGEITVGTADRLQGGQWHCVVSVDPTLSGAESEHALSSGRLCVMASRHMTHMTWVYDAGWQGVLEGAAKSQDAHDGLIVRHNLLQSAQPLESGE